MPTILCAPSGKTKSIVSAKNVPLPTEVRPTMKPPNTPIVTAAIRSRHTMSKRSSSPTTFFLTKLFSTRPVAPKSSAPPRTYPITEVAPSPYLSVRRVPSATPSSENGALPINIQPESRACTVPRLRCRIAPTVLKIAPWRMSVPTASVGWKPNRMTRIGVISDPPPIPVIPTRVPISRPVRTNCQVTVSYER